MEWQIPMTCFPPKENVKHLRVVIDELATEILKAIWKRLQWCAMWSDYHASDAAKLLNWRKDSAPIIKDVYSWRKHPWLVWTLKRTPATKPPRDFSRGKTAKRQPELGIFIMRSWCFPNLPNRDSDHQIRFDYVVVIWHGIPLLPKVCEGRNRGVWQNALGRNRAFYANPGCWKGETMTKMLKEGLPTGPVCPIHVWKILPFRPGRYAADHWSATLRDRSDLDRWHLGHSWRVS